MDGWMGQLGSGTKEVGKIMILVSQRVVCCEGRHDEKHREGLTASDPRVSESCLKVKVGLHIFGKTKIVSLKVLNRLQQLL